MSGFPKRTASLAILSARKRVWVSSIPLGKRIVFRIDQLKQLRHPIGRHHGFQPGVKGETKLMQAAPVQSILEKVFN